MRFKRPMVAVTAVSLLALAACGGDAEEGSGSANGSGSGVDNENLAGEISATDPEREGPVEIEGATEGGTITVLSGAGLNSMDPSEAYYQNTISLLQSFVVRSLTQVVYDPETKGTTLVPDLATDLGTSNEDFTEWTFTIRDGVRYENGDPVTAEDVKFGLLRSMDRAAFPEGAGFSNEYFEGGADYEGPYTAGNTDFEGITVEGNDVTIKMSKPFPDMPYWGTFPAISAIPEKGSQPAKYRKAPLSTGPYKFADYTEEKSLTLVRNEEWDPATDPGRTAYPDSYEFSFNTDNAKIDQILLADKDEGQTTLTFDDVLSSNYRKFTAEAGDRLALGGQPLTTYWCPDYRKITDINVRKALAYAYPYKDALLAAGAVEGVTRIPGIELLPPGLPGRKTFNPLPDREAGETDAAKAKALLEEAGEVGYTIRWPFSTDDPLSVAAKDKVVAAFKEAGFNPKPYATTIAEFSTVRGDPDAPINVRPAGWLSDWPSGGSWIPPLLASPKNVEKSGFGANYCIFSEPEIDQAIEDVQALPIEDQADAWGELDERIQTEFFPFFVTAYGGVAQAFGSKIAGMEIDPAAGMPSWKNIYVSS